MNKKISSWPITSGHSGKGDKSNTTEIIKKSFEGMLKSTQAHRYRIINLVMKIIRISELGENLNIILTPSFNLPNEKFKAQRPKPRRHYCQCFIFLEDYNDSFLKKKKSLNCCYLYFSFFLTFECYFRCKIGIFALVLKIILIFDICWNIYGLNDIIYRNWLKIIKDVEWKGKQKTRLGMS